MDLWNTILYMAYHCKKTSAALLDINLSQATKNKI